MKVLFAVNNENISESIIKKYQKDYKEILTYKNVYYFNAILKELQKDKSYDRIVISEDLEPFANNNYDIIDKFLFEKLDKISDEATESNGNDTPIILICTDRRSKSDSILVKLFGIGIYSAIIGQDRSIDEVCRLIYMPRTKKEAKQYYRIESDDVAYKTENESNVSEVEIQNILAHYKRLGKNAERYVDSFNNIAAQYTDSQLRVIVKFLPLNVKAVLESESPRYQELMTTKDGSSKKQAVKYGTAVNKPEEKISKKVKKGIELDAFETKASPTNLVNSVVIPSEVNTARLEPVQPQVQREVKSYIQKPVYVESEEDEYIDVQEEPEIEVKKGRGRPRKVEPEAPTQVVKKGRGRPKKVDIQDIEEDVIYETKQQVEPLNLFEMDDEEEEEEAPTPVSRYREPEQPKYEENSNLYDLGNQEDTYEQPRQEYLNEQSNSNNMATSNMYTNKVVAFVGTTKNGTSFLVNNLGLLFSSLGVRTAILDLTANKNSYYIFTKNDEELRRQSVNSFASLNVGQANGVEVNKFLTSYTSLPGEKMQNMDYSKMIQTLRNNYSLVLVDCDFTTANEAFRNSNEIYLIQSMDILTIQPFTAFMRDLKTAGVLDEEKLRVVINKYQKLRGLTDKVLIGGLSSYNDPAMSFMTELFNKDTVKYVTIPLDIGVYTNYLEGLVTCELSMKGYSRGFSESINILAGMMYPMPTNNYDKKKKSKYNSGATGTNFSPSMNNTLNQMKNRY